MNDYTLIDWLNMLLFNQGGHQPATNPLTVMTGET